MSRLIKVADWDGEKRGNVIFVHGLGGHPYDTWRCGPVDTEFWPLWLAQEVDGLSVHTLGYNSPPTNWLGTAMPLLDEAAHALRVLLSCKDLRTGSISFVCHSLGGLIVKSIIRSANEQKGDPAIADFYSRVRQVIFIATPHVGSGKANLLQWLSWLSWPSASTRNLVANQAELRDLNFGYRRLVESRGNELSHLVYYEMVDTVFGGIVSPASADPGLPNCNPTPIREDHISIAKPHRRDALVYIETRDLTSKLGPEPEFSGRLRTYPLEPFKQEWSWMGTVPGLFRFAAIGIVLFALWHGLPRLYHLLVEVDQTHELSRETLSTIQKISEQIADLQAARAVQPVPEAAKVRASESIAEAAITLAERTDDASKRAFEALKRNDTAAAEALFTVILNEKTRAGQAANREAANAARNIAAFTRISNVAKAADLYGRATELDPENYENWIDLGDVLVTAGRLTQAKVAYARALAIVDRLTKSDPDNLNWQRALSVLYNSVGNVQAAQGELDRALKYFSDSLAIRDRLTKSNPGNVGWQRDLSVSYNSIGDVQMARGDLAGALRSYKDGLATRERLAKLDPSNLGWQRDLSVSYNNVGDVQMGRGDLPGALASFSDSLAIRERLAKADPDNVGWQRDLSVSYNGIGDVQVAQGNFHSASMSYNQGLTIRERLAKSDPSNAGWQRDLSVSYNSIGDVQLEQGDLAGALKSYSDSLAIRESLANIDSGNLRRQRDLSVSYNSVGDVQLAKGDVTGALKSYSNSLAIRERLAKADPDNLRWQRDLSVSYKKVGTALKKLGETAKALEVWQQGKAVMASIVILSPDNTAWRSELAWFDTQIANLVR